MERSTFQIELSNHRPGGTASPRAESFPDVVEGIVTMEIMLNGAARDVAADTTIAGLLAELGLDQGPVAVELNLEVVPRVRHGETVLAPGDRLEIVTLVGGG